MMKDFYLNRQFFNTYLGCYYPLGDVYYLHVKSCKVVPVGYKKSYVYDVSFCVHYDNEFVVVFVADVVLTSLKIQLSHLKYVLDSDLKQALFSSFPIIPLWLIPCTRVSFWLKRCYYALLAYRNYDWI